MRRIAGKSEGTLLQLWIPGGHGRRDSGANANIATRIACALSRHRVFAYLLPRSLHEIPRTDHMPAVTAPPPPPSKLFVCSKTIDYVVLCRCVCLRSRETSKRPFGSFRSIAPNAKNSDEHMCWRFKLHGLLASAICFVESVFQSIKSIKKERNVHVMKYKLLFELQIMIIMLGCNMLNHNDCRASIGLLYDKCHQSRPSMQGRSRSTGTCFNMVTRLLTFSPAFYTCTLCYY